MGISTYVRHRLGRWEIPAANIFRAMFVDLDALVRQLVEITPASRLLEVGCGDGILGQRLVDAYPDASYLGIDIAPTTGRLYRGEAARAEFRAMTVQELVAEAPQPFDVVLLVDVLHHVPRQIRNDVLHASALLVRPGGYLVVKDWERNRRPHFYLAYVADRYLAGDKTVEFLTGAQLRSMVSAVPGFAAPVATSVGPGRNNLLLASRRLAS